MANTITVGALTDLQVKIPVEGTSGWATDFRNEFVRKIVEHNHSGENGQGRKIGAGSLAADIVTDQEIRLRNDEFLRARNAADDGDVDILKVNGSDVIELASALGTLSITPVSADPSSPEEGQIQISDGTTRPAGLYTYVDGSWLAAPNNVTASNQGTGEGLFIQKTGDDLEFKSLTAGEGVSLGSGTNEIEINTIPIPTTFKKLDSDSTGDTFHSSISFSNLEAGTTYEFTIYPVFSGSRVINAVLNYEAVKEKIVIQVTGNRQEVTVRFTPDADLSGDDFLNTLSVYSFNTSGTLLSEDDQGFNTYTILKEVINETEGGF